MRSVGLMAILLLFVACKPVARGPVSDLEAVTDGNLTLGVVAAESNNGVQAYRLLVCRKSASYPKWMLEDNNRCRPALLDNTGSEVVFIHDEFERDFATKYSGYAKGFAVPALIGVGAWAAVFGHSAKGFIPIKDGQGGIVRWVNTGWVRKITDPVVNIVGKITGPLFGNKVSKWIADAPGKGFTLVRKGNVWVTDKIPGWLIVPTEQYRLTYHMERTGKFLTDSFKGLNINGRMALSEGANELSWRNMLKKLTDEKSLLEDFKKADDKAKYISDLEEQVKKMGGQEFVDKTNALFKDPVDPRYFERLPKSNQIVNFQNLIKNGADFNPDARIAQLSEGAAEGFQATKFGDASLDNLSIDAAQRNVTHYRLNREHSFLGLNYENLKNFAIKGAAGVALVTMTDLDKSIWGYDDRQTSMHWSQVFSEAIQSENQVKDLPALLSGFASFFGHHVNPQALALSK